MNPILIKSLNEKFPHQFEMITDGKGSYIKFPAKSHDFGDVIIYEDYETYIGCYTVEIGKLTHIHLDMSDKMVNESVEEFTSSLEALFSDRLICFNNGWFLKGDDEYSNINSDLFVWSGVYRILK